MLSSVTFLPTNPKMSRADMNIQHIFKNKSEEITPE